MAKISPNQYAQAYLQAAQENPTELKQVSRQFLLLLTKHKAFNLLSRILRMVEKIERQTKGILKVTATTAQPLPPDLAELLKKNLKKGLAVNEIELVNQVEACVLGGLILDFADTRIDASISQQLALLHKKLIK